MDEGKRTVRQKLSGRSLSGTLKRERADARKKARMVKEHGKGHAREHYGEWPALSAGPESAEAENPQEMAARLYRAFAGQVEQLEVRLNELFASQTAGDGSAGLQEIDRTVKTLASLAKTLSALMELKNDVVPQGEEEGQNDPEALRAELARRLEGLCGKGPS